MGWPQYVFAGWVLFEIGHVVAKHGQPKTDEYNAVASIIVYALMVWILCMGDFFKLSR